MARADDPKICTTNGPAEILDGPAPGPINEATGQHTNYWILCQEERDKGFVRPVRRTYIHVGAAGPQHPVRDLTDDEKARYADVGYVAFEAYPPEEGPATGRFWTKDELDRVGQGCGAATTMSQDIAETYARSPGFYGKTFCVTCRDHLPVGKRGEFVWEDGSRVGT